MRCSRSPFDAQEFVIGKYAGLVLTLFVNLAIMAVAYYAVLGAVAWIDGAWFRPHWEAPAVDPALLKAIAMIFLQLAIVVAIALFFSTFSSPMLAAALTFGLYVVGHFNADLKNFESVIDSKAVAYARPRAVLRAAEPGAARHQERRGARRARARDVSLAERRVQRSCTWRCWCRPRRSSSGAGISNDAAPADRRLHCVALAAMLAVAIALQVVRDRAFASHSGRQAGPLRQQRRGHAAGRAVV